MTFMDGLDGSGDANLQVGTHHILKVEQNYASDGGAIALVQGGRVSIEQQDCPWYAMLFHRFGALNFLDCIIR